MTTNREFAEKDAEFREACFRAGIEPTARQASKFKLHFGKAWQHRLVAKDNPMLDTAMKNGIH